MRLVASCTLVLLMLAIGTYSSCAAKKQSALAGAQVASTPAPSASDDLGGGIIAGALDGPARLMAATVKPRHKHLGECLTSTTANKLADKTGKNLKIERISEIFTTKVQAEKVTLVPTGKCRLNGTVTVKDVGAESIYSIGMYITNMATKEMLWNNTQQVKVKKTK